MSISIARSGLFKFVSSSCLCLAASAAFSASDINSTEVRINVGGTQYKDSTGKIWSADFGYNGGVTANTSISINNTNEDPLYQSSRRHTSNQADLAYAIPIANGKYNVKLHFVENYSGALKIGGRVFKVSMEGSTNSSTVDIFKEAGAGHTALIRTFPVEVKDNKLNIAFSDVASTAIISAIEVTSAATTSTSPGKVIYRINAGGQKITDSTGVVWNQDAYYLTGVPSVSSSSINVIGTADDEIYLAKRRYTSSQPDLEYAFPVSNGNYSVRLHFTENYEPAQAIGKRVMDIYAEEKLVRDNFDIYKKAGAAHTVLKETISGIKVADGKLNIRFKNEVSIAHVSALEVIQEADSTVSSTPKYETIFRVNAGGEAYKDHAGNIWKADSYFSSGKVSSHQGLDITGTVNDTLYMSNRRNSSGMASMAYSFPVENGEYSVNLLFSENYEGAFTKGARVFDVYSEGNRSLQGFDIYAKTGSGRHALVQYIPGIQVKDGKLDLRFEDIKSVAFVSGIEVKKRVDSGSSSGGDTSNPETTALKITSQPSNQIVNPTLNVTMSVAAVGPSTISYQWYFNGNKISNATSSSLKLTSVTSSQAGNYYCLVSSGGTTVKSNTATLVVSGTAPTPRKDVRVTWVAPTKRADGTNLAARDIAKYEVFHAMNSTSNLKQIGTVTADQLKYIYKDVEIGTHYFAIKAVDKNGVRSKLSSTVKVIH